MAGERRVMSPAMESLVKQLAAEYGIDLSQQGMQLSLGLPTRPDRWLIANLDGKRICLTRFFVEEGDCLAPDLDMVFALTPHGWEPLELLYADELWEAYVQAAQAAGIPIYDEQEDTIFAHFTEYWAQQLAVQGWLTHSRRLSDLVWPRGADESCVRMAGCQSTHSGPCYGELWQCASCGKIVCYAEGSDNHPELCDDCWRKHQSDQEDDHVPF
jgi:hypothetical protein